MPLSLDPEFAAAITPMAEAMAARPKYPAGDVKGRRATALEDFAAWTSKLPDYPDVVQTKHEFPTADGTTLMLTEFAKKDAQPTGAEKVVYYIHGGGMILGSVEMFSKSIMQRVSETGIRTFAVSYRLAPEFPHPTPVEDCFAGLSFLSSHASKLSVDPARIVLWGESAGGGLAAGMALMARDRKLDPPIAKQILIFPMLDDRNLTPISEIEPFASWRCDDNITGWNALLEGKAGSEGISEYAAPARAKDLSGLPPTYIDVGNLDIFVHEDLDFAARLMKAGVMVECHVYPGMPHGFQLFGAGSRVAGEAVRNVMRAVDMA